MALAARLGKCLIVPVVCNFLKALRHRVENATTMIVNGEYTFGVGRAHARAELTQQHLSQLWLFGKHLLLTSSNDFQHESVAVSFCDVMSAT